MPDHSISQWLSGLRAGEEEAQQVIWATYVEQLIRLAHSKLANSPKRAADEDDVVGRAFTAFFEGVRAGRFSDLADRDDLWQVLVMLTDRKAIDQQRAEGAQKRGGGNLRGDSVFNAQGMENKGFDQLEDPNPTPRFAVQATENFENLMAELSDPQLERIAIRKMEGYKNREIAKEFGLAVCTIERKLARIRRIWDEHNPNNKKS